MYYKSLCAAGGVFNIYLMMIANLVGFAIGLDGVKDMLAKIFHLDGVVFVGSSFVFFFSLVMVMFEVREAEANSIGGSVRY
jgi:D-alanyl-lipoteichoic acid acyltransferase DltB (MBOAT superfamily)